MKVSIDNKITKTNHANLSFDNDEILHVLIDYRHGLSIDDAKEIVAVAIKMSKNKKFLCLMKSLNYKLPSREVRILPAGDEVKQYITAMAFIAGNSVANIAAKFFLQISKPPFPFKIFSNDKEAIVWLKSFQTKI